MKKKYLLVLIGIFFPIIIFQNCSGSFLLSERASISIINSSEILFRTSICSEVSFLDDDNNNFLFILDMSSSNIGQFREEMKNFGGQDYPVYYWDPEQGTDVNGLRYQAIENFMNLCASSSNNKFSVIGFAEKAGHIQYDSRNRPYLTCGKSISFKSKSEALNELDRFRQAEESESVHYSQWVNNFYDEDTNSQSLALRWTSYSEAAECASKIVYQDLISSIETQVDNYQIFFISDGSPGDSENSINSCINETGQAQEECYMKNSTEPFKNMIHDVLAVRRNINIFPIAYGKEEENKVRFLDAIASIQQKKHQSVSS